MSTVIIRTFAYNAEKTLERTIKSVLNQTHQDFIWYLLDNGSTDSTGKIISKYAKTEKRIISLKNEYNRHDTQFSIGLFYDILNRHADDCYFCTLDSDDVYSPYFFETMLTFIQQNHLDIAACSVAFTDGKTNKVLGLRSLYKDVIVEGKDKEVMFQQYYQFMRTIWGKLYSFAVLRKCNFQRITEISYGNDTLFAMEAFRNAKRIGISQKVLHQYFLYEKSVSNTTIDSKRVASSAVLLEKSIEYLSEYGEISNNNKLFIFGVYYHSVKDTLSVLLHSNIMNDEKLKLSFQMLTLNYSQEVLKKGSDAERELIMDLFLQWLKTCEKEFLVTQKKEIENILCAIRTKSRLVDCLYKEQKERFLFLVRCLNQAVSKDEIVQLHKEIQTILSAHPLTASLPFSLCCSTSEMIGNILEENYLEALNCFKATLAENVIPKEEKEFFLLTGQFLAAKVEDQTYYIKVKKQTIQFLLEEKRKEEAITELADFDKLLPQDTDFMRFRQYIDEGNEY